LLNNYLDRDIDRLMSRTRERATAAGRVEAAAVLRLGLGLAGLSFIVLMLVANLFAATLAVSTIYFYVVVYTLWLKRNSDLCTEIGGIAGALPPLIGWAAVTGSLDTPALLLFLIMFLWQPPHFWVLALLREEEYRRAGIPMLPVTAGAMVTKAKMLLYTASLLPATISLFYTGVVGTTYLAVAVTATLIYLVWTVDFCRRPLSRGHAIKLFLFSIAWLLIVFTVVFVDSH
jgi:protoheme IX farnesyltransferase